MSDVLHDEEGRDDTVTAANWNYLVQTLLFLGMAMLTGVMVARASGNPKWMPAVFLCLLALYQMIKAVTTKP